MQGLKIQGLSPFYFSKVQLVSRLPLFAIRSALAHVKIQKQKKNLLTGVRFYKHMSQWPACGGSSSLGALFTLKPCRENSQLAKWLVLYTIHSTVHFVYTRFEL